MDVPIFELQVIWKQSLCGAAASGRTVYQAVRESLAEYDIPKVRILHYSWGIVSLVVKQS